MTIKECIDIVDNIKPNQYTIKDKVMWLSFIEEIIINEVLKTHEGYDGRYDDFSGYTEDKISVVLIVPSPYDRIYTEYLKMMIDKENGEVARYNNSAASYNTYMMEYKKHYNKTHMPLSSSDRRKMMPAKKTFPGLTDAEYENIKKDMTYILTEYFEGRMSNDRIYEVVNSFVQNNIDMLKGKAGYTPIKGVDYFNESDMEEIRDYLIKTVPVSDYNQNDPTQPDYIKNRPFYTTDSITVLDIPNVVEVIGIKQPYENYELQLGDTVQILIGNSDTGFIKTISEFPFRHETGFGTWTFYSDGWVIESANREASLRIEIPSQDIKIDPKYIPDLHYVVEWDEEINETFRLTKKNIEYDEDSIWFASDSRPIGLVSGNIYNVHVEVTKDGVVVYNKELSVECKDGLFSVGLDLAQPSDEFFDDISVSDETFYIWKHPDLLEDYIKHINLGWCGGYSKTDFDEMNVTITGKGKHPVLKLLPKYITPEGVQSDYNQNDSEQPDYIKNKPNIKNTEHGGMVLGNIDTCNAYSPGAFAAGNGTTVGTRGYKMLSLAESGVESEYSTIEVASKNGLEVGQRVSICGISTYVDVGTIQGIDANSTSADTFVVTVRLDEPKKIIYEEKDVRNYFTVVNRPELGDIDIGVNAWAVGEECIAIERDSLACGIQTTAIGKYSSAFGVETIAFGHESHAQGHGSVAKGCTAHAEGVRTIASGSFSHAEGMNSKAEGMVSHAEGHSTIAKGLYSHAEGINSVASGDYSHAEGSSSKAEGVNSHAEGYISTASGNYSHAEGGMTTASGAYSHAEGVNTVSSGAKSHAEGNGTIAASENQHVEGKFNIEDSEGRYAHIIGNGMHANNRKNAHTVDWKGNAWYAGVIECAGVVLTSPNGTKFKIVVADDGTLTTSKM